MINPYQTKISINIILQQEIQQEHNKHKCKEETPISG